MTSSRRDQTTTSSTDGHVSQPGVHGRPSRRRRNRSQRPQGRTRRRYKDSCTSMRQFSAMQIIVGLCAIFIQVGLIVNHSFLSDGQQGIWTGAFFILSGIVCLVLGSSKVNFTGTMIIMCCCLVTLFVAMTLASLGWIGVEASLWCEYHTVRCNGSTTSTIRTTLPNTITTQSAYFNVSETSEFVSSTRQELGEESGTFFSGFISFFTKDRVRAVVPDDSEEALCQTVLQPGFCGWMIEIPRVLYSFLMLLGVTQATVSFMMAAVACTSKTVHSSQRLQPSISFIYDDTPGTALRSIRAWELPPTQKEVEAGLAVPNECSESEHNEDDEPENDPPPPYEYLS